MTEHKCDADAIIAAARSGSAVQQIGEPSERVAFLPNGENGQGSLVSLERYGAAPIRKRGIVKVFDAASFNMVVRDNSGAGDASIYIDREVTKPAVVAVMNGNGPNGPGWSDFRVEIEFRPTPQWLKWKNIDGKMMEQATFAEFVEDNAEDVSHPTGAHLLEMVTTLQATRTTEFRKAIRLSNGQVQFTHTEDIQASVGAGQVAVPEVFTLGIAPFLGCEKYAVPARFRYRIADGKLTMGFKLQRVEDLMQSVLNDIVAKIERGANISVLEGRAPQ